MTSTSPILGIDIGSVCIHIALIDSDTRILHTAADYHHGEIRQCLERLLDHTAIDLAAIHQVAKTSQTPSSVHADQAYDGQLCRIRAARLLHQQFHAILHIGGENFSLSRFDDTLTYLGAKHNTSCAAGTGSFLDQQARRLNLSGGSEELSKMALANTRKRPDIATRCAVFAKTDLIHAQQEGFDVHQICDGLCYGLAKNIANTLFKHENIGSKIIFCGGVAANASVQHHLETLTGYEFVIDEHANFYGAVGAALCHFEALRNHVPSKAPKPLEHLDDLFVASQNETVLSYPELTLKYSAYPDFNCFSSYMFESVEADIYQDPFRIRTKAAYLGMDVGSTSTKSILIDETGQPIAGFYTKTASQPVRAVQQILKAYDHFFTKYSLAITIKGCGTTGSGRRISGKILEADIEPDEITAHATAASNLNQNVDTIIEIGGQDAKFTLLKNGIVTASTMNSVCAAGTGSFIEEQALKLECPLSEYSSRTEGVRSPVASDRCTVFMERDINYYLAQGYKKNEILASVLHSVRDNYLTKVANIAQIGECILFQGATAKNKALVAAFEQKLNKPIHVSKYCHLTGALGVALLVKEKNLAVSAFRGFDLWQQPIPVRQEVCHLCTNNCKITLADISGQTLAYGFLCGRDYHTQKRATQNHAYDLFKRRKMAMPKKEATPVEHAFSIGIPAGLHLFEDTDFWVCFFEKLGIKTITSDSLKHPVRKGKIKAGAEFCAPVVAMHGHVQYLLEKADYVFLPFYFEEKQTQKDRRRQDCYYTQFAPSVIACLSGIDQNRLISPIVKYLYTNFHTKLELYKSLKKISSDFMFSFMDIASAYEAALEFQQTCKTSLKQIYTEQKDQKDRMNVVLLGRPYTVLSKTMNNNIPSLFENLGVNTFFQDMIDFSDHDFAPIDPLLREIHWKYVSRILKTAYYAASSENLYPVYISSFKCSPDAFGIEYFKQIMEKFNKPYLVLELDEHDSSVGYETRIEAAVRAFENHRNAEKNKANKTPDISSLSPRFLSTAENKTIIFPNWDAYTGSLLVAILKSEGYQAFLMEETAQTLKKSILTNTGQCIPLNAVAAGFINTVKNHGLNPADCALWLNPSEIACNIKMYPYHIQKILEKNGNGFEKTHIYKGELSLFDISFKASTNAYFAYMFGGLLRSVGCRIRPYELDPGATDQALEMALDILRDAFESGSSKETALQKAMQLFSDIAIEKTCRPKVGIFGDLYARDNDIMNQDLIHFIENHGGEVITTPYYKYVKIIASSYFKKWFKEGKYVSLISNSALLFAMQAMEKKYYRYFEPILDRSEFTVKQPDENILSEYGILQEHTGESMDNILKIHHIINEHPDLKLLVQTNPAFCCPGLITESMTQKIESRIKVPIVSITYDVSGGNKNAVIIPFLKDTKESPYSHNRKVSV